MLRLVDSGIPGLDAVLGGGFYRPSSVLIKGPEGTGKTTLLLQSLCFAARSEEPSLYVQPPHDPMDVTLEHLRRSGFFTESLLEEGYLTLMDLGEIFNDPSADILQIMAETMDKGGFLRVGVDNLEIYRARFGEAYLSFLASLIYEMKRRGAIIFLVTSEDGVEPLADAIITLSLNESRYLRVEKHRGSDHLLSRVKVELTEDGFMVFPSEE